MKMEDYLKSELKTEIFKRFGKTSGGCISSGSGYQTDNGKIFVKRNSKPNAGIMFKGEFHGLKEIYETETVKVPEALLTGGIDSDQFIVMEYNEILPLTKFCSSLGRDLAELHLHNIKKLQKSDNFVGAKDIKVNQFGFHVTTCCGYLAQNNEWSSDWVSFVTSQRLLPQIQMIEREKNCREISELWSKLQLKIPSFFNGIDIKPSLLHGDLWIGNAGETNESGIIFDPASFYGHHEYDLAIAGMFGGFGGDFYRAYHEIIPKMQGFEKRHKLYQLFHHLNHWNHFGGYKHSSLQLMRDLIK